MNSFPQGQVPPGDPASAGSSRLAEQLRLAVGRLVRETRTQADTLPAMQAEALGQLIREGPCTIRVLADTRGVRHQGMSRMVADLERAGLVVRSENPSDARGFVISISKEGRRVAAREAASRRDWLARAIDDRLDASERDLLGHVPHLLTKLAGSP